MFATHYRKELTANKNIFTILYNYYTKLYKFHKGGGYGTLLRHIEKNYPNKVGIMTSQSQIQLQSARTTSTSIGRREVSPHLFSFDAMRAHREVAKIICTKYSPFSFFENGRFTKCLQQDFNHSAQKISR